MRDITHFPSYLALRLPDFSRTQVSLMAAPGRWARCATSRAPRLEARSARSSRRWSASRTAARRAVHDRALAGIIAAR